MNRHKCEASPVVLNNCSAVWCCSNLYIICTYKFEARPVTGLISKRYQTSGLISKRYQTSGLISKKISDLWLAQVWYLTDNAWLGVHYCQKRAASRQCGSRRRPKKTRKQICQPIPSVHQFSSCSSTTPTLMSPSFTKTWRGRSFWRQIKNAETWTPSSWLQNVVYCAKWFLVADSRMLCTE